MSIRILDPNPFPDPELAENDGLLAFGGNLSPEFLLTAYYSGIFPWFDDDDDEIVWWSPNPRLVLFLDDYKVSSSTKQILKINKFSITFDANFEEVIRSCKRIRRKDQENTWITDEMVHAYCQLHKLGYAHSVESWYENKLVGGLYGIAIGKVFCGESMFHTVSNASKVAFYYLVEKLKKNNFTFIDAQVPTHHLKSLGAKEIPRSTFLSLLKFNLPAQYEALTSVWSKT